MQPLLELLLSLPYTQTLNILLLRWSIASILLPTMLLGILMQLPLPLCVPPLAYYIHPPPRQRIPSFLILKTFMHSSYFSAERHK